MDSHSRSIAKAISYRLLGSGGTAFIFYLLSGDVALSAGAGGLDILVKTGLYFLHERLWNHVTFGRPKSLRPPDYEI